MILTLYKQEYVVCMFDQLHAAVSNLCFAPCVTTGMHTDISSVVNMAVFQLMWLILSHKCFCQNL